MENMTRRSALLAAAAISMSAAEASASDKNSGEAKPVKSPLLLHIVLPDGQVIDLKATELVIDFGGNSRLLVKHGGIVSPAQSDQASQGTPTPIRREYRPVTTTRLVPVELAPATPMP